MEYMTDGSGALQPMETDNTPQYLTREDLQQFQSAIIARLDEQARMMQEHDAKIIHLETLITQTPRKEETITPAEVDTRISDSEQRMLTKFENIAHGFQTTVKEVQRVWEAHVQESMEYRKGADLRHQEMGRNILELRKDQIDMQRAMMEANAEVRKEVQVMAGHVQTNESNVNINRTLISDIDARGQKLGEGYADLKQDVRALSADFKAGQAHLKSVIEDELSGVKEDQKSINTFMTEHRTRSRLLNGIGGAIMTLLGLLTTAQADQIRAAIFGG